MGTERMMKVDDGEPPFQIMTRRSGTIKEKDTVNERAGSNSGFFLPKGDGATENRSRQTCDAKIDLLPGPKGEEDSVSTALRSCSAFPLVLFKPVPL